ncbi:MAG: hypothetical protein IKN12_09260 [Selenomonadaceae bacterium]|nr:hypothetical protein [Selenomonadaceae bacterium]
MSLLRQEASQLLETMPDKYLLSLIGYMRNIHDESIEKNKKRGLDITKYSGSAGYWFGSNEEIEEYIKDLRDADRF